MTGDDAERLVTVVVRSVGLTADFDATASRAVQLRLPVAEAERLVAEIAAACDRHRGEGER